MMFLLNIRKLPSSSKAVTPTTAVTSSFLTSTYLVEGAKWTQWEFMMPGF